MLPTIWIPWLDAGVSTYSVVLAVYFPVALLITLRLGERKGIDPGVIVSTGIIGVPVAIAGARLLDILEYAASYRSVSDVLGRQGSSIYGALAAAFTVVWLRARFEGISSLKLLDAGAPAMALGEAMSRIGCFTNGCCYGVPSDGPLAVSYSPSSFAFQDQIARGMLDARATESLAVHPVQLYSAAVMLGVFAYLLWETKRTQRQGVVFCLFLIAYGALRLAVAPLRMEALTSMRVFSVVFILAGVLGLVRARRDEVG